MNTETGMTVPVFSLPGRYSAGDLDSLMELLPLLEEAGTDILQILPLNHPDDSFSPYRSLSLFAFFPAYIGPDFLYGENYISRKNFPSGPLKDKADVFLMEREKEGMLAEAYGNFIRDRRYLEKSFLDFCSSNVFWLEKFAAFMSGPAGEKTDDFCLSENFHVFLQYMVFSNWFKIKEEFACKGIALMGDMPFASAPGGADVFCFPEVFFLDDAGSPLLSAGAVPDDFTPEGQKWNLPVYRWDRKETYGFWEERFRLAAGLYDYVRIDHFRGIEALWAVDPAGSDGKNGVWLKGPGQKLLNSINEIFPRDRIIAEDLGYITPEVEMLLENNGYCGMKMFLFTGLEKKRKDTVLYLSSHDTPVFASIAGSPGFSGKELVDYSRSLDFRAVFFQLQDYLGLGNGSRVNVPGTEEGNWQWRWHK